MGGSTDDEKVDLLIKAIQKLKDQVNIPKSISAAGVKKEDFYATLDEMSELAFDDQCTAANPRYPLIKEIKAMYIKVFE
ncbi:acetaldehyde-CoA dehydrogenase [Clostridium carboxidivorans P7]|uniref:Bifunctional acetaldehyde-CoA/alcohol dehydrogenase n=1 Tax=Clostridium carboxidivorans P7 TaxID=536227 RepID=C6PS42_9CLOT|nr:acetaldehyde-CoA dehydrogenase [Clostridium carboxidivorans P7]EET87967.1 bifunctional acetaldehyde-CoA/alcohol dehydrogenase [Clostridium carboxidivorans P7]